MIKEQVLHLLLLHQQHHMLQDLRHLIQAQHSLFQQALIHLTLLPVAVAEAEAVEEDLLTLQTTLTGLVAVEAVAVLED
jgi:hypothetical protein